MSGTTKELYTGAQMPQVGLGTWQSEPGKVGAAVECALRNGYKHIDCAFVYGNEAEIGAALTKCFSEGIAKREEIWITSKLWNTFHHAEHVRPALERTLADLQLDYLDLYLIHWPYGFQYSGPDERFPKDEEEKLIYDTEVSFIETWKVLEECHDAGLVKHIGISNFNSKQLQQVLDVARVKPAVLQVECHPLLPQVELGEFAARNGIAVTCYSPFGSPGRAWATADDPPLLENAVVAAIAQKHGKTNAQVLVRFGVERGRITIPKSVSPERIISNFQVWDFTLDQADLDQLLALATGWRACLVARDQGHPYYPFNEPF